MHMVLLCVFASPFLCLNFSAPNVTDIRKNWKEPLREGHWKRKQVRNIPAKVERALIVIMWRRIKIPDGSLRKGHRMKEYQQMMINSVLHGIVSGLI